MFDSPNFFLFNVLVFKTMTISLISLSQSAKYARVGDVVVARKRSVDLLNDPLYNKGSAFPPSERDRLGIRGMVPPRVQPKGQEIEIQASRILKRLNLITDSLEKYGTLRALQDRNEVLFYHILANNIEDLAKIIYTPTVGRACLSFAHIFRRTRGMYFSSQDRGNMHAMVYNWPVDDGVLFSTQSAFIILAIQLVYFLIRSVQCIVVTDGSRILGLGDLGANGIGIPIGKLSLYTVGAGFHPSRCLPVQLDVGTNNAELLADPLYLGLPQERLKGSDYYDTLDEFIRAVNERWPKALIQFEDFSNENALPILERYRNRLLCFNDDIQGIGII
jgi:malic enzyme